MTGKSRDEYQDLFFGEEGLCSHGITVKAWQLEFNFRGTGLSYAEFIKREVLNPSNDDAMLEQLIWLLGNQMPRRRNQDQNGGRP